MLADATQLPGGTVLQARFCIIGSGMAGGTLAQRLVRAGHDVVLVEAGGSEPGQSGESRFVQSESTGRSFNCPVTRCIELGGTSNQWHGICCQLDELDFIPRSWISHSGWPITRSELQPYYDAAATVHDVPPTTHDLEHLQPQHRALIADIALHRQILRNKIVYARRPPLRWKSTLQRLAREGSLKCLIHAPALKLVPTAGGRTIGKIIVGAGDHTIDICATWFIISCGALETPRLLLNSGVGNEHDLVGRFLMDHPAGHFGKMRFHARTQAPLYAVCPVTPLLSVMSALMQTPGHQEENGVANHYAWIRPSVSVRRMDDELLLSFLSVRGVRDLSARQIFALLTNRDLQYRVMVHKFGMRPRYHYGDMYFTTEQLPNPASRIQLSGTKRDRFGFPIANINWQLTQQDLEGFARYADLVLSHGIARSQCTLARSDPLSIWERTVASTAHHLGTARMGTDPTRGVVDRNLKIWGLDNAYVCDGAVFPTSGAANPSLTITALAVRLADHLVAQAAAGASGCQNLSVAPTAQLNGAP